ncbi:MAG: hypothetical protein IH851_03060 [Armatimonadetes bacterium]|nr:hypothetical protein [Armatimonadota bacterium]
MDIYDAWNESLEDIKKRVTGTGTWNALNIAVPVAFEDGVYVLGFPQKEAPQMGHLRMAGTQRVIEKELEKRFGAEVRLQLLEGITIKEWNAHKRRRAETDRLGDEAAARDALRAKAAASWDTVFEKISHEYGATENKAMPQSKARLLERCVDLCAEAVTGRDMDDAGERNFARCLDRIATYCEVPSAIVARLVLERAGRL